MMKADLFKVHAWLAATVAAWLFIASGSCWAQGRVCACVACWVLGVVLNFVFCWALDQYAKAKSEEGK